MPNAAPSTCTPNVDALHAVSRASTINPYIEQRAVIVLEPFASRGAVAGRVIVGGRGNIVPALRGVNYLRLMLLQLMLMRKLVFVLRSGGFHPHPLHFVVISMRSGLFHLVQQPFAQLRTAIHRIQQQPTNQPTQK